MKSWSHGVRVFVSVLSLFATTGIVFVLSLPKQEVKASSVGSEARPRTATYDMFAAADAVTRDVRSNSKKLFRVTTNTADEKSAAAKYGRIVGDYGSFVVVASDERSGIDKAGLETSEVETTVNLPGAKFDPLSRKMSSRTENVGGEGYYIVQFGTIATDELLDSLKDAGIEVLQYIPHQAFLVYAKGNSIEKAVEHSRVRWVGSFLPEYKISPVLADQLSAARSRTELNKNISRIEMTGKDSAIFDVAVFDRADLNELAGRMANMTGGKVQHIIDLPTNYFNVVRIEMPLDKVEALADIPDVITIDSWGCPKKEDERSNQIIAGNYTNPTTIAGPGYNPLTQFLVNGTGTTVSVVDDGVGIPGDGGFYITASNAVNGPMRGAAAGASGHGHLNATIIAGGYFFSALLDPTGYNYGLGVAPKAHIVNIPLLVTGYTGVEADVYADSIATNGPNGVAAFLSNNSWGNGTNGNAYDAYAAQFDGFVRDASPGASIDPISIIFSAGNSGASGLTRPKVAKNLISVGSGENLRSELAGADADNMEDISSFSSRGPAADTRIKPDISAPGAGISGGRSGTDVLFGNIDANHRWSEGTSHAAPQVAGAAALFTQFWKTGHAGANPSPALIKAALINGAVDMTGTTTPASVPNGVEGWGRMNLKNVLNTGTQITYVNQDATLLTPGAARLYAGSVGTNTKPVRISLVWTDPPAAASPALINDLDLTVTVGGNTYKGNVLTGGLSQTGGVADNRNNVENVFLPVGTTGPISIGVSATALNGDGDLANPDTTDQHYALVVYNATVSEAFVPVISAAGPVVVTAENRFPLNGAPDPGETVTVNIPLTNSGTAATGNLVATLEGTGGVTVPSGPQNYGAIAPGGPAVTRPFTLMATGVCGGNLTLTFSVQDGATNLGVVTFTKQLGTTVTSTAFTQNFDGVVAPALPAGWTTAISGSLPAWVTSTTNPDTPANDAFAPSAATVGNTDLISPTIPVPAGGGQVTFKNLFNLEASTTTLTTAFDGAVLEISVAGGPYQDIVTAGGSFVAGGYNKTMSSGFTSPLAGRQVWSGLSGGTTAAPTYITTTVNLPPSANGQNINLKWRTATDSSAVAAGLAGVRVDSISISLSSPSCSAATAGGVEISGRVLSSDGRGVTNAKVTITDGGGVARTMLTGRNGTFAFEDIEAGHAYVVTVGSRRFNYEPRVIQVTDNVADLVFMPTN